MSYDDEDDDYIDFPGLIDHAMRDVVRNALLIAETQGLPGDHHFFLSFKTDFPGVEISDQLASQHPHEMTIVLQHQFWDLKVDEDEFSVTLSFNNIPEKLTVPFMALTAFADPSVKFGLQFHAFLDEEIMEELMEADADLLERIEAEEREKEEASQKEKGKKGAKKKDEDVVVALDAFRKKKKKEPASD